MAAKSMITEADALFLGTVLEGLFFGLFIVLYALFRYVRAKNPGNDYFAGSITLLFVLCTIYWAVDLTQQYITILPDEAKPGPLVAYKLNIAASVLFSIVDFVSQIVLQYRCYLIWGNIFVVAVPFLISLAALGGEFALCGLLGSVPPERTREIVGRLIPTGNAAFSLALACNALTTGLIVLKIYLLSRETAKLPAAAGGGSSKSLRPAVAMVIESGLFTFIFQLLWVVFFSLNRHPGFYLIGGMTTMVYGITPTVLALRVIMGTSYDSTTIGSAHRTTTAGAAEVEVEHASVSYEKVD